MRASNYADPVGQSVLCTPAVFAEIWALYFLCAKLGFGFRRHDDGGVVQYAAVYAPLWECPAIAIEAGDDRTTWVGEQSSELPPTVDVGEETNPTRIIALCREAVLV